MIINDEITSISLQERTKNKNLAHLVSLIVNRLFNNNQVFLRNLNDVSQILIQSVDLVKHPNFRIESPVLANSLFSMIYNLIELKLQSNESKYLDLCVLIDLAECLADFIGSTVNVNTVNFHLNYFFNLFLS